MKKFILAFGILCSLGTVYSPPGAHAQTADIESADEIESGDLLPIKNGSSVSGYAFIAKLESGKEDKKMRLKIFDENLKEAGSADFEVPKNAIIRQAFFEGGALMLAVEEYINTKEKKEFVKTFQLESKATTSVTYEPDEEEKKSGLFGKAIAANSDVPFKGRFKTVEGLGLMCTYVSANKNGGLTAQLVGTDGRRKWKRKITGSDDKRMDVHLLTTTPKTILFFASVRDGIMDRDSKNLLIGLDAQTGRQVFRKPLETGAEAWEPVFFKAMPDDDTNSITVCNMVSDVDDKFYKATNTGFNYGKLNLTTGAFTNLKTIDYSEQLSKVLSMKNESKSEEGYLFIEDLIAMPDNSLVVVGEFFKNTVSATGVALTLLSRGGEAAGGLEQGTVGDMFALRLSPEGAVQSMDKLDKDVRRCQAFTGISTGLLCRYMAAMGSFSYQYTDELADNRKTVIVASNMKSGENGINAVTFTPGKGYKVKNLASNKDGGKYAVLQGKPGHVLVVKSDRKGKKATISYQKVD
jgi:hypothetical protein